MIKWLGLGVQKVDTEVKKPDVGVLKPDAGVLKTDAGVQRISADEFDEAVKAVMGDLVNDDDLKGEMKLIVPLMGSVFASKMRTILFEDNKGEN